MGGYVLKYGAAGLIALGLILARKYPDYFGFLALQFGTVQEENEPHSSYILRKSKYWFVLSTYGLLCYAVLAGFIDKDTATATSAFFHFLFPILVAVGYLRGIIDFVYFLYHKRAGT